jgi:hypothetical protein
MPGLTDFVESHLAEGSKAEPSSLNPESQRLKAEPEP